MVRSHTSEVAYPDLSEYAEQLQAFTTRPSTQRRVSALPLNPAASVQDAQEVDDIVNTTQLQYWVKKNAAAVLAMIENLRTDRDEGLDLAL